ncbi:MAG: bifunctional diaminohydroxyphosphoribosylaminopyrimidine deaminase/5-amino-6-(5-phosphoribosylamino)uracil reductase RibD [Candidatus Acidiferrales bacterium]
MKHDPHRDAAVEARDDAYMSRALELARHGVARVHPNPLVGAVVVRGGRIVGEGFHTYERQTHAEPLALARAGARARGATLYVNLEPCCHTGRSGPCTAAILAARVRRVVTAMADPNPVVSGRGIRQLRRAGVQVDVGVRVAEARELNEAFSHWMLTGRPFVTLKAALTLDGQIASPNRKEKWITSSASRDEVQHIRHAADAILCGVGTVIADNPRMTDRTGLPRRRALLRVVLDSKLRLPLDSRIVRSADGDVLVFTTRQADPRKAAALARRGVEVVRIGSGRGRGKRVSLREAIVELGRRQILSVLLEAGSRLNGSALDAKIVDKMVLFYAPRILGATVAPMALRGAKVPSLGAASVLANLRLRRVGPDFVVEGYFTDVYGNHRSHRKD